MVDLIKLVKEKQDYIIDFSQVSPEDKDVRRVINFFYQSLPEEQREDFLSVLRDRIKNKEKITLMFGRLPTIPSYYTKESEIFQKNFGVPTIPTREEVEKRFKEIEQKRQRYIMHGGTSADLEKLDKEKKQLEFILREIIPAEEIGGVGTIEKLIQKHRENLQKTVQNKISETQAQIIQLKNLLKTQREQIKNLYPFSTEAITLSNEISKNEQKLRSLVSIRNNYKSLFEQLNNQDSWYKDLFEGLYDGVFRDVSFIPFYRAIRSSEEKQKLLNIQRKQNAGEKLSEEERLLLEDMMTRHLRNSSMAYGIGYALSGMPAWSSEIAMLQMAGGVLGISPAVVKLIKDLGVKAQAPKKLLQFISLGTIYGAMNIPQLADSLLENMLDQRVIQQEGDKLVEMLNKRGDDFWTALRKAFGSNVVETTSEFMGVFVNNWRRFFPKWILNRWFAKRGIKTVDDLMSLVKKGIRWDGIIGEVFEEELARLGQTLVHGETYHPPYTEEGAKYLLQEAITIGLWGGILELPNLPSRIQEITQKVQEYRNRQRPPIITEKDIGIIQSKARRQKVSKEKISPEVEQVIQEAIVTPPPAEPFVTAPPGRKISNVLFDKVSTIENLQEAYKQAYEKLEQRIKETNAYYDEYIKSLTEEIRQSAKLVNADPEVLKEQIQSQVEVINEYRKNLLDLFETRRLSLLASYNKRLKELRELDIIKEPAYAPIQLWQNTLPEPVNRQLTPAEQEELERLRQETRAMLETEMPKMSYLDKEKFISSIYKFKIMLMPLNKITIRPEIQETLRPILQKNLKLIESITKFFDVTFYDLIKIAHLQDTGEYVLFDGHHRYSALQELEKTGELSVIFPEGIPALVFEFKNLKELLAKLELLVFINEKRHGLNLVEQAKAYKDFIDRGHTIKELAEFLGRKEKEIEETLYVNKLSQKWKKLAVEKEEIPSIDKRIDIEALVRKMAFFVNKYNIAEPVQDDILENWVIPYKLTATSLGNIIESVVGSIESSLTKEEKSATLDLFSGEQWKTLRSRFSDIIKEMIQAHKQYISLMNSYKKTLRDKEERLKKGEQVSEVGIQEDKRRVEALKQKIKELQEKLVEVYKGRSLTAEEKQNIKFKAPKFNPFEEIDKLAEGVLPLFPDETPTDLGFRLTNDMRQVPTLLTLKVKGDAVIAEKVVIKPPVSGYDYFLLVSPTEQILFGVEKEGRTEVENASMLASFLGFNGALAKDEFKNVWFLLVKPEGGKVKVDTKFLDGKMLTEKQKQLVENALRQYFKSHIPVVWGIDNSSKSEQLLLFEKYDKPVERILEQYITFVLPGGFLRLVEPVEFNVKNVVKLFNKLGIPFITPNLEIEVILGLKNNKIVTIDVLPVRQTQREVAFDATALERYKDVDKFVMLHRHPTRFIEILYTFLKKKEFLVYNFADIGDIKSLIQDFMLIQSTLIRHLEDKTFSDLMSYEELEKILKQHLTPEQINRLYEIITRLTLHPSETDLSSVNELKRMFPDKVLDKTYIFNDGILEIDLKTNSIRFFEYKKTSRFKIEQLKSMFTDIPIWWHWNYYATIGIPFDLETACALSEIFDFINGWVVYVKNNKIARLGHIKSLFEYIEIIRTRPDLKGFLFDFDSMYVFVHSDRLNIFRPEILKAEAQELNVNISLYEVKAPQEVSPIFVAMSSPFKPEGTRVYKNILKRYGQYFSETELEKYFERRFGYSLTEVDSEDGLEFRRFLDKLLVTEESKRGEIIKKWFNKEVNFAKVSQRIKNYLRKTDRPTLLKQLRVYAGRNPEMFYKIVHALFGKDITNFLQLDTDSLRKLSYWLAYVEADETLRKTAEYLSADEWELSFWDKLKFGLTDFWIVDSTFQRLGTRYKEVGEIRDLVIKYLQERDHIRGRAILQLDKIRNILGDDFVKRKFDKFVDYIETQVMPADLTEEERKKVEQAYKLYKDMMDWLFVLAEQAKVLVFDPVRGMMAPIEYRENYFPHIYPRDFLDKAENFERVLEDLAKTTSRDKTYLRDILELVRKDLKSKIMPNLEMHRYINIPGYKKTFDVLIDYVRNASERISWVKHFGNDVFITPGRGFMPEKLLALVSKIDNKVVRDYVLHVFEILLYRHYHSYEFSNTILRAVRKLQTPKLALASIENIWQWFVNFSPKVPFTRVLSAIEKALATAGLHNELLEFYGLSEQLGRALVQQFGEEKGDVFDVVGSAFINLGFKQTEKFNRLMVIFLSQEYVEHLRSLLKKNKIDKVRYELETLGVTQDLITKIIKQRDITQDDYLEILWTANAMTNYLVDLWFMPFIASKSEFARTIFQFVSTFVIPQTRLLVRQYVKPFFDYIRSGGKKGNALAFAKFLIHSAIAFSIAKAVRDWLARRDIVWTKEMWENLQNYLYFLLMSGWFGLYGWLVEMYIYGTENLKNKFIGVGLNYMLEIINALWQRDFVKIVDNQSPLFRYYLNWLGKKQQKTPVPTFHKAVNELKQKERTLDRYKARFGSNHQFTVAYYKNEYLPYYIKFLKKYGGIYYKLYGRAVPLKTLSPTRREVLGEVPNL